MRLAYEVRGLLICSLLNISLSSAWFCERITLHALARNIHVIG
jgi:hypothetical protein